MLNPASNVPVWTAQGPICFVYQSCDSGFLQPCVLSVHNIRIAEIVAKTTVLKTTLFRVYREELENRMSTHNVRLTYTPSSRNAFMFKKVHPLSAVSIIERTVKSTSIANISKATTAFNMPPGEHSSSVEKFWLDPKPQFNDDTAPNVLELYIIPHDAMSGANEMAAMSVKRKLSIVGSTDFNMANTED